MALFLQVFSEAMLLENYIQVPAYVMEGVSSIFHFFLTMAMVGLGLNVSFKAIKSKASRPLIAMLITSLLLSVITFFIL